MSDIVSVYAVFADAEEAGRIGRDMVERRLAACVNILAPCRSIYRWEGAIEEAVEVPALFKTSVERVEELIAAIGDAHSYEVPAIVAWPVTAVDSRYHQWVSALDDTR